MSIPSAFNGQPEYQDVVVVPRFYTRYTYGAALWNPVLGGPAGQATIVVYDVNPSGLVVARHAVSATVTPRRTYFQGSFIFSPLTAWMRFEIYVQSPNTQYEFTEAWIAPQP